MKGTLKKMDFKNKQELLEYLSSLDERISAIEPKDDESKDGDGDGKDNEDIESLDEIEKLLED